MDFNIEKIEQDDKYYYITYTFLDLIKSGNAWEYQLQEKIRNISKKFRGDLGVYLAEDFKEMHESRLNYLKGKKEEALADGPQVRTEVVEYSGLIGAALDLAGNVFDGYEPIKTTELPSPERDALLAIKQPADGASAPAVADNLTDIYNNYVVKNDPDGDDVFGAADNCPDVYNPGQEDSDQNGLGDACDAIIQAGSTKNILASTTLEIASTTPVAASSTPVINEVPAASSTPAEETSTSTEQEVVIIDL